MADYISREAAIDALEGCQRYKVSTEDYAVDYAQAKTELMMLPSAQPEKVCIATVQFDEEKLQEIVAKAIIRCKDCKDYDIINQPYDEGFCRKLNYSVDKDSFCSYGERREE